MYYVKYYAFVYICLAYNWSKPYTKKKKHVQVNAISDFKNWHPNTQVMWERKVVKDATLHHESKFIQLGLSVYASKYLQSIQFFIFKILFILSLSPCNPPLCILLSYFRGEIRYSLGFLNNLVYKWG